MSPEATVIIPLVFLGVVALLLAAHRSEGITHYESKRQWDRDAAVNDCTEWAQQNDATPGEGESED